MKHLVVLAILAFAVPAAADNIVLECFTGGKTEESGKRIAPLLEALENRGFASGLEVARKFEGSVSRPANPQGLPADFTTKIEDGSKAFFSGKFEAAITILGPLIDRAHANGGAFAGDQSKRELLFKGLVVLALSQQRMGDTPTMEKTFGELMRSFPQTPPPGGVYGGDAVKLFTNAQQKLAAKGRGKLVVRTNADNAIIYIDEKIEGSGTITREGLLTGEYRVFAQVGKQLSRSHRLSVKANETTTLAIDISFDLAVQTSPTWTGLAYSTAAERKSFESAHAAKFAASLRADAVATVGIDDANGKPAIVGILVNKLSNSPIRTGIVPLDPPPSPHHLTGLAEFLAGQNMNPQGVEIIVATPGNGGGGTIVVAPPVDREPARGWRGWKLVAGGLGIAAVGTGAVLLGLDGRCRIDVPPGMLCGDVWNTATPGYVALGSGAVLVGISIYLFVRKDGAPARTAFVAPTGDGVLAGFAGRF